MKSERMYLITFVMLLVITVIALISPDFSVNISITGFVAEGRLPTIGGDSGNWGSVLNTYLTQEHTAEGGHKNVTVEGNINITGNLTDTSGGIISIPSGAVMYFNMTTCPTGWNEMQEAVGRYFVAINTTGTLGAIGGTALSNIENRAVGEHLHEATGLTASQGTHSHSVTVPIDSTPHFLVYNPSGSGFRTNDGGNAGTTSNDDTNALATAAETSAGAITMGGSTATNGSVAGTNAPYIQLLVCVKT